MVEVESVEQDSRHVFVSRRHENLVTTCLSFRDVVPEEVDMSWMEDVNENSHARGDGTRNVL